MMDIQREFENFEACMEGHETAYSFFEAGAKAALEYARGQKPVAVISAARAIEPTIHGAITLKPGDKLYTHPAQPVQPASCQYCDGTGDVHGIDGEWRGECNECKPAAAINEQMLEALKVAQGILFEAGYDIDDGGEHFSEYAQITEAIAAAEAAKGAA